MSQAPKPDKRKRVYVKERYKKSTSGKQRWAQELKRQQEEQTMTRGNGP